MSLQYSPKIVTDSLVMCLDASQNKSYPTTDLPIKDGLNLWLDAADDTTFSYSSGATVSQWRDKSGQNNHAIVMGGSPLRSVAINSRKAVSFTSTTSFKCVTGAFISTATHIVVCRATTSSATYQRVYNGGGNSDLYVFIGALANNIATFWGNGSSWNDINANSPSITILNTLRIISAVNTGAGATPYYDGTAMTVKATNPAAYTGYELNTYATGNLQPLVGEVCEIIVFNKQLSTTELKQVHTYLGQKWGISNTDRSIVDLAGNDDNGLLGNGTVANMPVYNYYNKGGLRFNSSFSNYVISPNTTISGSQTFCVWAVMTGKQNSPTGVLSQHNYVSTANFGINILTSNQLAPSIGYTNGTREYADKTTTGVISYNQIFNAVLVYDAGLNKIYWYINGVFDSQYTLSLTPKSTNWPIGLGRWDPSYNDYYFDGTIFSALIYNRVLSAAEVLQNYEAQKSKFANTIVQQGLILNLDAGNPYSYAGAGGTWFDVSGNGKIGTLTGGVTYSSLYGGDFIFDGVNGYIQTDLNQNTDNAQITWEAWFWDNSPGGFFDNTAIISNYGPTGTTPFTILHIISDGRPYFGQRNSSGTESSAVYSVNICDGVWHHIVGVVDNSNMLIYVDGVLRASQAKVTGTTTSGQNLVIGGNHLGRYQSCRIASARIYSIALSAAQVLQNYNATKGRFGL